MFALGSRKSERCGWCLVDPASVQVPAEERRLASVRLCPHTTQVIHLRGFPNHICFTEP